MYTTTIAAPNAPSQRGSRTPPRRKREDQQGGARSCSTTPGSSRSSGGLHPPARPSYGSERLRRIQRASTTGPATRLTHSQRLCDPIPETPLPRPRSTPRDRRVTLLLHLDRRFVGNGVRLRHRALSACLAKLARTSVERDLPPKRKVVIGLCSNSTFDPTVRARFRHRSAEGRDEGDARDDVVLTLGATGKGMGGGRVEVRGGAGAVDQGEVLVGFDGVEVVCCGELGADFRELGAEGFDRVVLLPEGLLVPAKWRE